MATIVRYEVDGQPVDFAIRRPGEQVVATGAADRVIRATGKALDSVFAIVSRIGRSFSDAIEGAPVSEAEIEFSLDVTAEGDLYVVSGSSTAAIRVTMTFPPPGEGQV